MDIIKFVVTDKCENNSCKQILVYVLNNIEILNKMDVRVDIILIKKSQLTKQYVSSLKLKDITSFPTLITRKKTYNGVNNIKKFIDNGIKKYKDFLETNKRNMSHVGQNGAYAPPCQINPNDYYEYQKQIIGNPQDDKDDIDDDKKEMDKRMREYNERTKKQLPHRGADGNNNIIEEDDMNSRIQRNKPAGRVDMENNIDNNDDVMSVFGKMEHNQDSNLEEDYWKNHGFCSNGDI